MGPLHEKEPEKRGNQSQNEREDLLRSRILKAVQGLQYGQVEIIVRDGRIVQIERTEKLRYNPLQGMDGEGI